MIHRQKIVYSLLVFTMLLLIVACGGSSNDGDDDNGNAVVYQEKTYAITAGLKRDFELNRQFSPLNHSSSAIQISDGEFFSTLITVAPPQPPVTVWRPRDASVWLSMDLYALGTSGIFWEDTYNYVSSEVDEDDPSLSTFSFFQDARFRADSNDNGDFEDDERFDVVGGTMILKGEGSDYTVSFDLILENGERIIGSFSGSFIRFCEGINGCPDE